MRREKQIETLELLLKQRKIDRDTKTIDAPIQVPASKYYDDDLFKREMETAFSEYPLVAGASLKVREPGSYILSEWADFPYVVIRDYDNELRAFLNICQHRGTPIISGTEESIKSFVCPYHGWTYGLDGKLRGVTKPYTFPDLDCDKHNLVELSVAEHDGLIWVHPKPGAEINIPEFLGEDLDDDLKNYKFEDLVLHKETMITLNANWKLLLKSYLDRYHVPVLHKNSIAPYFVNGVVAHQLHGPHIRIAAGLTQLPEAANEDPEQWHILKYAALLYAIFPNTYLINHTDLISIGRFYPIAPDKTIWCHGMYHLKGHYQDEEGQKILAERFSNIDAVFGHEDFGNAEKCQKFLRHGPDFHTLGMEEGLLAIFQQNVDKITQ